MTILSAVAGYPHLDLNRFFPSHSSTSKLFPEAPVFKGVSPPTVDSLQLKNEDSKLSLDQFFRTRYNENSQDRELAEKCIQKVLRDEHNTASPKTRAYLLALEGQFHLTQGDWKKALGELDKASELSPADPTIMSLELQAYEKASRTLQDTPTPWPLQTQKRIQNFGIKIEGLKHSLRPHAGEASLFPRKDWDELTIDLHELNFVSRAETNTEMSCYAFRSIDDCASMRNVPGELYTESKMPHKELLDSSTQSITYSPRQGFTQTSATGDMSGAHQTLRSLSIGVGNYKALSGFPALRYADIDAKRISRAFERLGYNSRLLLEQEATKQSVSIALTREVAESRPGDTFILYYSGHGFTDKKGRGAILLADPAQNDLDILSLAEIRNILSFHKGKVIVILDSCLSTLNVELNSLTADSADGFNIPSFIVAGGVGGAAIESNQLGGSVYTHTLLQFLADEDKRLKTYAAPINEENIFNYTSSATQRLAHRLYGVYQRPVQLSTSSLVK